MWLHIHAGIEVKSCELKGLLLNNELSWLGCNTITHIVIRWSHSPNQLYWQIAYLSKPRDCKFSGYWHFRAVNVIQKHTWIYCHFLAMNLNFHSSKLIKINETTLCRGVFCQICHNYGKCHGANKTLIIGLKRYTGTPVYRGYGGTDMYRDKQKQITIRYGTFVTCTKVRKEQKIPH